MNMKRTVLLLLLGIIAMSALSAATNECYIDVNGAYMLSNMSFGYEGDTFSMRGSSAFAELAVSNFMGHFGFTYRFRFGKVLTLDGEKVDSGFGYNQEVGLAYITEASDGVDVAAYLTYFWLKNEETGYETVKYGKSTSLEKYTITSRIGEVHLALEAKYHMSSSVVFNMGVELGIPLFYKETATGYYYGTIDYDVSGFRVQPFAGLGFRIV